MLRQALLSLTILAVAGGAAAAGLRGVQRPPALSAETARLDRELADLRAELVRLGRAQAAGENEAAVRRARLRLLDARENALRAEMGGNRVRLARLLGALQLYQRDPPPPLFVHAGRARDAARAAVLMKTVAPELGARGRALSRRAEALRRLRRDLLLANESLMVAESELAERRADIDGLQLEQAGLERSLPGVAQAEARARALARSGSLNELVGGLQVASRTPSCRPRSHSVLQWRERWCAASDNGRRSFRGSSEDVRRGSPGAPPAPPRCSRRRPPASTMWDP